MRYLIALLIVLFSCKQNEKLSGQLQSIKYDKPAQNQVCYDTMKLRINHYKKSYLKSQSNNIEKYFVSIVIDSIIPYWYGTKWDFNGTSQTPGVGKIACGYFVTTVLRDAGVPLNRVRLAQAASSVLIKELSQPNMIKIFSNSPLDQVLKYIIQEDEGLFIVGLENHVGFLYNDGNKIWFIHSKWANPDEVVKEDASQSAILYYSNYRMIGKISSNKALLNKWRSSTYKNQN